jgi:MoaA/NifB/PqqE/SkfB family radical SAM enzyme
MSLLNELIPGIDSLLPLLDPGLWLYLPNMQCNFKCAYCYMDRAANPRGCENHSYKFKFPEKIKTIKNWIILYGGEPLSDKKLLYRLILAIRQLTNAPIVFSTNGSLLSYKDVNFFKTYNVKISVSYDGEYQKYRGLDIFKNKKHLNILYKAYKKGIIYGINTVIHNKNFYNYKFDIPEFKVIHDYNYIYPIENTFNKKFLLDNTKADIIAKDVAFNMGALLKDIQHLSPKALTLKYPPYLFSLLNSILQLYTRPNNIELLDPNRSLCGQTNCVKVDIYGNIICGKGLETKANQIKPLGNICVSCRYGSICSFKCPSNKFDRSLCKDSYVYKTYRAIDFLLQGIISH